MRFPHALTESGTLLDMPSGRPLRVTDLQGSPSMRSKLYAMGILPGTVVELCRQSCGKGSVCVRVRQCSLVLGESMARAIYCLPVQGHGGRDHMPRQAGRGICPEPDGVDVLAVNECGCCSGTERSGPGDPHPLH